VIRAANQLSYRLAGGRSAGPRPGHSTWHP
jgi:hypothetical protein